MVLLLGFLLVPKVLDKETLACVLKKASEGGFFQDFSASRRGGIIVYKGW